MSDTMTSSTILPHTGSILLVDTHTVIDHKTVEADYTIPHDHPVLNGHFPTVKIWPGVYLIEGMNQTAGVHALYMASINVSAKTDIVTFVTKIDKVRFRRPVTPGEVLKYRAKLIKSRANHVFYDCEVHCNGQKIAQATVGLTAR